MFDPSRIQMMTRPFVNCTTLGCAARIDVPRAALPKCYLGWYYLWASSGGETTCFSPGKEIMARHVHVYKDGKMIVKWDLENEKAMRGRPTKRVLTLIRELEAEGLL